MFFRLVRVSIILILQDRLDVRSARIISIESARCQLELGLQMDLDPDPFSKWTQRSDPDAYPYPNFLCPLDLDPPRSHKNKFN